MPASLAPAATETTARVDVLEFITSMTEALAWPLVIGLVIFAFHKEIKALLPKLASLKAGGVEASFTFGDQVSSLPPLPTPSADVPVNEVPAAILEEPKHQGSAQGDPQLEQVPGSSAPKIDINQTSEFFDYCYLRMEQMDNDDGDRIEWLKLLPDRTISVLHEARLIAHHSPRSSVTLAWRGVEITARECARKFGLIVSETHSARTIINLIKNEIAIEDSTLERYLELNKLRNDAVHSEHFSGSRDDALQYIYRAEELAINITIEFHLGHAGIKA